MQAGAAAGDTAAPAGGGPGPEHNGVRMRTPGAADRDSVFPPPLVHEPSPPLTSRGAGSSQRRTRAVARRVNEAVRGLDWLAGFRVPDAHGRASLVCSLARIDEEVLERIWRTVARRDPQVSPGGLGEPATALLKGRSVYADGADPASLASYGAVPVSLPVSTDGAPWLEDVVDDEGRHYLLDLQCMLRSEDDVEADAPCDGPIRSQFGSRT